MIIHRELISTLSKTLRDDGKQVPLVDVRRAVQQAETIVVNRLWGTHSSLFTRTVFVASDDVSFEEYFANAEFPFISVSGGSIPSTLYPTSNSYTGTTKFRHIEYPDWQSNRSYVYFLLNGRVQFKPADPSTAVFITYKMKPFIPMFGKFNQNASQNNLFIPNSYLAEPGQISGAKLYLYSNVSAMPTIVRVASQGMLYVDTEDLQGGDGGEDGDEFSTVSMVPDEYESMIMSLVLTRFGVEDPGMMAFAAEAIQQADRRIGSRQFTNPPELF